MIQSSGSDIRLMFLQIRLPHPPEAAYISGRLGRECKVGIIIISVLGVGDVHMKKPPCLWCIEHNRHGRLCRMCWTKGLSAVSAKHLFYRWRNRLSEQACYLIVLTYRWYDLYERHTIFPVPFQSGQRKKRSHGLLYSMQEGVFCLQKYFEIPSARRQTKPFVWTDQPFFS